MKAILRNGTDVDAHEVELPSLKEGWARIRVEHVGLCGTDVAKITTGKVAPNHTDLLGHEMTGVITEICDTGFESLIGERVVIMPILPCLLCSACLGGRANLCERGEAIGRTHRGAFAEYVDAPIENLTEIGESGKGGAYVLADSLATCLHAEYLAGNPKGSTNLVIGDGIIAALLAWHLHLLGRTVLVKGIHAPQLAFLEQFGISTTTGEVPIGAFDRVYETVGRAQENTMHDCVRAVHRNGYIVVIGVYAIGYELPIAPRTLFIKEGGLKGSNAFLPPEFSEAVTLIGQHVDTMERFISHRLPLAQFREGLACAVTKQGFTLKIVFSP